MADEKQSLRPVEAFSNMFTQYLEKSAGNLVVGNFVLLRNILKEGLKRSYLSSEDEDKLRPTEELWLAVNKGCSCTKNKRLQAAEDSTRDLINSPEGRAMLEKLKVGYNLHSLKVDVPTVSSPLQCNI